MTLGELLTELRENILHDRSDRVSGESDRLWSDATLVRYINEAQRRFARFSLILRDGTTPDVTQVTLQTGVTTYTLHESVLAVLSARRVGDNVDLARAGHAALDTYRQPDTYYWDPSSALTLPAGAPRAYSTDETIGQDNEGSMGATVLRIFPEPSAAYNGNTIQMRVIRLPIETFTVNNLKAMPELPEDHHLEMLDWAAYLALRIVDVDLGAPNRANEFRASFESSVKTARDAMMRKFFTPLPWGFGRNGFSWER